uniref:F-box domain-containing protein n=1 Tax=Acrobeloides nanus TaxID=290746 RepID=A0A914C9C2_9BILA
MAQLAFSIMLKDRVAPSTGLTNQECFYAAGKEYETVVFAPEPQTADQKIYGGFAGEVEHVEGMIHQQKHARLCGDDKLTIQNDNLLTVLQYLTDEEIWCLKLVNRQWKNLIFSYVKHLPKLEIKNLYRLRGGLVQHQWETPLELNKFPKETYFRTIIVESTQKNFEYLQNHVAKNGSVIGRNVALSTFHKKDLNFFAFEPRMIDNLIVSMDCLNFDMENCNIIEKAYLLKRPSYFYSVHAKKVKISLGWIGPILAIAFGGTSPETIVEFIFDENTPLDNRHKFSMSGDSDGRTSYFADNFIRPLFVGFYKVG